MPSGKRWLVIFAVSVVWTAALALVLSANITSIRRNSIERMRHEALSFLEAASASVPWSLEHGGAAPGSGKAWTGMIASLLGRAGHEESSGYHLASVHPRTPAAEPDPWESRALSSFAAGSREASELLAENPGREVFRYMAPLRVDSGCVNCHAEAGFRVGDLRGGVSVTVPARSYVQTESKEIRQAYVTYGLICALGLTGAGFGTSRLLRKSAEAKRAAAALRESEERFRSLFEDAPVAYHEIDSRGIVLRVNRAECELLGYNAADLIGKPIWQFVSRDAQELSRNAVRQKLSGELPLEPFCREYSSHDGKRIIVEVHENLIRDVAGDPVGIRSSLLDVTRREQAQRALAHRTAELSRSNAELERFAYVASHDLQEPLRKVMAFGDRLRTKCGPALDEQGRDYLERMRNAAGRMQVLINDLLMLSRIKTKAQPFVRVNLDKVLRDVLSDLEVRIEQLGARVDAARLPEIEADPLQMAQLLQNLVGNALKFHRPGVEPAIAIECRPAAPGRIEIAVCDNGIGFDEKYLDRIFEVFQRLHGRNEYEGTGVGLAICRQIVERHRGTITARSTPGEGARFILTLPVEQTITDATPVEFAGAFQETV